jgi:hypothetical protein
VSADRCRNVEQVAHAEREHAELTRQLREMVCCRPMHSTLCVKSDPVVVFLSLLFVVALALVLVLLLLLMMMIIIMLLLLIMLLLAVVRRPPRNLWSASCSR